MIEPATHTCEILFLPGPIEPRIKIEYNSHNAQAVWKFTLERRLSTTVFNYNLRQLGIPAPPSEQEIKEIVEKMHRLAQEYEEATPDLLLAKPAEKKPINLDVNLGCFLCKDRPVAHRDIQHLIPWEIQPGLKCTEWRVQLCQKHNDSAGTHHSEQVIRNEPNDTEKQIITRIKEILRNCENEWGWHHEGLTE